MALILDQVQPHPIWKISELVEGVLSNIDCGSDYKSVVRVCKLWRERAQEWGVAVDRFSNHLQTLIKMYPHWKWNSRDLSCNPNIDWVFIKSHPELFTPDGVYWFEENPRITETVIIENLDYFLPRHRIEYNSSITPEFIAFLISEHKYTCNWFDLMLSNNKYIEQF